MTKQPRPPGRIKRPYHRSVVMGTLLIAMLMTTSVVTFARQARTSYLPVTLAFSPAVPTIVDPVIFSVTGDWKNGCTPEFSNLSIFPTDHVVRIDAISNPTDMACIQAVTPFHWQINTFFDLAGPYQLYFYVKDGPAGAAELVASSEIDVKGGLRLSPSIAAVGESISVVASDIAPTACVPEFSDRTLVDQIIYIEMISPADTEGCATISTPWSINVPLADLAPRTYSVQLRITEAGGTLSSGRVIYRNPLFVFQTVLRTLLPIVARDGVWE